MSDFISEFRRAMSSAGMTYGGDILSDGRIHRFDCADETGKASWFVLHAEDRFAAGAFGCWRRNQKQTWNSSNGGELTREERQAMRDKIRLAELERKSSEEQLR